MTKAFTQLIVGVRVAGRLNQDFPIQKMYQYTLCNENTLYLGL